MTELSQTFAALGDPTRFAIVERLLAEGELSAGSLQEGTALSAPAVSRHLRVLREAGIVARRVERQSRLYSANPDAIGKIGQWALDHEAFWNARLDRLERALKQVKDKP